MSNSLRYLVICLLIFFISGSASASPICIIGAFRDEISFLEKTMQDKEEIQLEGIRVVHGSLAGKEVVLAYTGMGKVNAAMVTSLMIHQFKPSQLIFTGIAGGIDPELHPGDLVIAERCVQHDLNTEYNDSLVSFRITSPMDEQVNPLFYETDSILLSKARIASEEVSLMPVISGQDTSIPLIVFGTIATGDAFIASSEKSDEIRRRFGADAVEMEGAAVAQVCWQMHVPFIIVSIRPPTYPFRSKLTLLQIFLKWVG